MEYDLKNNLTVSENMISNLYKFSYYYFFEIVMPGTLIKNRNNKITFKLKSEDDLYKCIESNIKPNFMTLKNQPWSAIYNNEV
ncbi:MAG: hypothetical protein LBF97_07900 [Elusimicrobiota bacterium]|jgi:hypothetical protein|nr:hypothetical protein [Elusimicrobiota bacterium]